MTKAKNLPGNVERWSNFSVSIWLFTLSDIKTIIVPSFSLAFLTACASATIGITPIPEWRGLLPRVPLVLLWLWSNLLPFNMDNQRQRQSIAEDAINKPWRTLPSKRMRPDEVFFLMMLLYPIAFLISLKIGGTGQTVALMLLGFWYNNLYGSDQGFIVRNFINACGFLSFGSGAVEVLLGQSFYSSPRLLQWFSVFGGVIFTTVQTQDMYDQEGDRLRGRRTVPLALGDNAARWSIAVFMTFWCIFCPWFWQATWLGYWTCASLGSTVAFRSLILRTVESDQLTFQLWNLWLITLHSQPLLS